MDITFELLILLAVLSFGASIVNGGLGYGYSSLSTPLALLALVNRIINPVYVAVEAITNTVMLSLTGKANIKATYKRVLPILLTLVPGVIIGSLVLSSAPTGWVRFFVYASILPLILLQAGGFRRPIKSEAATGLPFGAGVGLLYSITTVSGPPIALFWNNQGLPKNQFKAAIAQIRIVESYATLTAYYFLGIFTSTTFQIFSWVAPPVLLGIPLGMIIVSRVQVETFRRVCMSFDVWIVGYGLAVAIGSLSMSKLLGVGYGIMLIVFAIDFALLYRFFKSAGFRKKFIVEDKSTTTAEKLPNTPTAT